ncbi:hypothetical protein [Candidatus Cyrtobacter comes]|nr:hypothetical protein [Candidatus Cyrtobacter comes]
MESSFLNFIYMPLFIVSLYYIYTSKLKAMDSNLINSITSIIKAIPVLYPCIKFIWSYGKKFLPTYGFDKDYYKALDQLNRLPYSMAFTESKNRNINPIWLSVWPLPGNTDSDSQTIRMNWCISKPVDALIKPMVNAKLIIPKLKFLNVNKFRFICTDNAGNNLGKCTLIYRDCSDEENSLLKLNRKLAKHLKSSSTLYLYRRLDEI